MARIGVPCGGPQRVGVYTPRILSPYASPNRFLRRDDVHHLGMEMQMLMSSLYLAFEGGLKNEGEFEHQP